jgi:hypothetical protein|tara:strand:+ start:49 stop:645 length:597 start_codon:yes stop_codon:yes gene_type:complete
MPRRKKNHIHYVNNKDFSQAVVEYVKEVETAKKNRANQLPIVPDYIATCFMRIAEGLSHKGNFVGYTYREEMVMDAVENCLKAILNYDIDAATRTGNPNAFAYFTQIVWYAFLRRIAKEKKQQELKLKYLSETSIGDFIADDVYGGGEQQLNHYVNVLKSRIDRVKESDKAFKEYVVREKKTRKKRTVYADSDLSEFL